MTPEQEGPYQDQQYTLARLLAKKYLTEVDRRRIMCAVTNMRMLCDSTFLFDKTTNVSPKLEEFGSKLAIYADPDGLPISVVQQATFITSP